MIQTTQVKQGITNSEVKRGIQSRVAIVNQSNEPAERWQQIDTPNYGWVSVVWSPDHELFVAVAGLSIAAAAGQQIMTSPNGITWTLRTTPTPGRFWAQICYSHELQLFITVNRVINALVPSTFGPRVMSSPDGINWTLITTPADNTHAFQGVCWAKELGLFVATSNTVVGTQKIMTSPDGVTWTLRNTPAGSLLSAVCWSKELGLLAALKSFNSAGPDVITSPDGVTWTARTGLNLGFPSVVWSAEKSKFVAVSANQVTNGVMTSPDGINWAAGVISPFQWNQVIYIDELDLFVTVGNTNHVGPNNVTTSPDGITWTLITTVSRNWLGVAWSPSLQRLVVVCNDGEGQNVMISPVI